MKKKIMTALAGTLFLMLTCSSFALAGNIPITPFEMRTPYGTDINVLGTQVNELDWVPGSGLAVNANAVGPGGAGNVIEFLYQLKLVSIIDINGHNLTTPTLNGQVPVHATPYEFTVIGRMWEETDTLGSPAVVFTLASDPTGGLKPNILEIYADVYDGVGTALVPTPGLQANVSAGAGFRDGVLVLRATPIELNSVFYVTDTNGNGVLDNQDYGTGSVFTIYQVEFFDPAFFTFPSTSDPLLIQIQFDGTLTLPPAGVETQKMWDGTVPDYYTGLLDGTTPFNTEDLLIKVDGNSHFFVFVPSPPLECRMTGGGVTEDGEILLPALDKKGIPIEGTVAEADDEMAEVLDSTVDRYQFGGQVGAPTASQPQPYGEWTHHQQKGPFGKFTFHAGTASAPEGTEIDLVTCSDPGFCNPARPAPAKQIDFEGVGTFKNVQSGPLKGEVVPDNNKVKLTLHWFRVHVEDIGEPGPGGKQPKSEDCTHVIGTPVVPENGDCENCPDVYQIEIHESADPASDVIYSVGGFIDNGNLQIHPPIK